MTTSNGGWTLVMKMTAGNTFAYSSAYWSDSNTLNVTDTNPDNDADMKNAGYNLIAFTQIRFELATRGNAQTISITRSSAKDLFTGSNVDTPYSRGDLLSWTGRSTSQWDNQPYCNVKGFNAQANTGKCRYGITMNNENECNSNDSAVGFGCDVGDMSAGYDTWGNCCESFRTRGWIYVR
jgi:hypothetical protein